MARKMQKSVSFSGFTHIKWSNINNINNINKDDRTKLGLVDEVLKVKRAVFDITDILLRGPPFAKRFTMPLLIIVTCTVLRYRYGSKKSRLL